LLSAPGRHIHAEEEEAESGKGESKRKTEVEKGMRAGGEDKGGSAEKEGEKAVLWLRNGFPRSKLCLEPLTWDPKTD